MYLYSEDVKDEVFGYNSPLVIRYTVVTVGDLQTGLRALVG